MYSFLGPYIRRLKATHKTAEFGEDVKFKCAVSPFFTNTYKWYFNGKEINDTDKERYKIKTFKFLRLWRSTVTDSGLYTCSVTNDIGRKELTYYLNVKGDC